MKIDAHQHYWQVSRGDYHWMEGNPSIDPINRDFGPTDLAPHLQKAGIEKTVVVQAAATIAETDYLLNLADRTPNIGKVVGWIDFEDRANESELQRLATHKAFSGVRPMIQDIADVEWMHRDDVQWAYSALIELDLTFDALGYPKHVEAFTRLAKRYPRMRMVVDHGMKPIIREREFDRWSEDMAALAQCSNVHCKCSGLSTEAKPGDGLAELRPYVEELRNLFGAERILWGSDWPVLNLASDYATWMSVCESVFPPSEHAQVFGLNAQDFYRI